MQLESQFDSYELGPLVFDAVRLHAAVAAVAIAGLLWLFFTRTRTGKSIRAAADNHMGALVVGLDVRRLYAFTFGVGAACVGAAGALMITIIPVTPFLAGEYTLLAFVIVIVGGLGSMTGALMGGLLIGVSEAVAGLLLQPSLKSMFSFGLLILVLLLRPQGLFGKRSRELRAQPLQHLVGDAAPRTLWSLAVLLALLLVAPALLGKYWLSVLILILYFAYVGQAWNIMMGFAGQLSLGHALYAGLGGYIAAGLFFHYGIGPWAGVFAAVAAAVAGRRDRRLSRLPLLAGRRLFRAAHHRLQRVHALAFDHWEWAGGSGGLFLKVDAGTDIVNLRGGPVLFYYVILALAAGAFVLCRALLESRLGRYWLAIREDAEAAQAVGVPVLRCKMIAIMISAALTALAGVWNAFYYNNLFPETAFAMGRSIEITLAPIIGGLGTLFGPIVGAVVLTGLGEAFTDLGEALGIPGIKQIFYGLALLVIVMYRPAGVWPWLAGKLGFGERRK